MKKFYFLFLIVMMVMIYTGISNAQTFEAFLNAGTSTVQAGLNVEHKLDQGKLLTGLSGIDTNDEGKFKLLEGHLAIGNEMLMEGLSGELGIKGIVGSVERGTRSGDLGGLGFMVGGAYRLPKGSLPISTKVFADLSWTPSPLAFLDTKQYFDMKAGIDFFLVENAALEFTVQHYSARMKNGPRDWSRYDNIATIGVKLRF
jgi:hypothetical protein